MSLLDIFFRAFLNFLGSIPYPILYRIGKLLSFLISVFPNKHKNITKVNLGLVFKDKTIGERGELLKKSLFHSSMNFLESGIVWNKKNFKKIEANIDIFNADSNGCMFNYAPQCLRPLDVHAATTVVDCMILLAVIDVLHQLL